MDERAQGEDSVGRHGGGRAAGHGLKASAAAAGGGSGGESFLVALEESKPEQMDPEPKSIGGS